MADDGRIRRTLLFVPGDDLKKITKAAGLDADSVILDLEDGVGISSKEAARATIREALTSDLVFGRSERLVRLNGDTTGLMDDDLAATVDARPDGFLLAKVETPAVIRYTARLLLEHETRLGLPPGHFKLLAMIETARGIVTLREIAAADARLVALVFGADDLAASLGATRSPGDPEVQPARAEMALYAAAYDLQAIDTPWVNIQDLDGLRAETERVMRMGYAGKTVIHPSHLEPINAAFTPSGDAVDRARRLIAAHDDHQREGRGVFTFEGRMIDMPVIRAAERVLARARAAGKT